VHSDSAAAAYSAGEGVELPRTSREDLPWHLPAGSLAHWASSLANWWSMDRQNWA